MSKLSKRILMGLLIIVVVLSCASIVLAKYPEKKIELVAAYKAGGGTDLMARTIAKYGEKYIGGNMFVTNKPGGSGAVGFSYGANAKPDGYTLTVAVTSITTVPHLVESYPITYKDYEGIALIATVPSVISVPADSKYWTLEQLLNDARENPNKITVGQAGTGSPWHLGGAALEKEAGVDFKFIPYKGAGPSITALIGGHLDATVTSSAEILPHVRAGKVRTLAIIADQRYQQMPNVPTCKSLGYNASVASWRGLAAPKGTPQEVIDHLVKGIKEMCKDEGFLNFLQKKGISLNTVFAEEFEEWMAERHKSYGEIAKSVGLAK